VFILLSIIFFIQAGVASAAEFRCPESIATEQKLGQKVESWKESMDDTATFPLEGITFFDGDPSEHASLVPDNEDAKNQKRVGSLWTFSRRVKSSNWFVCRYSNTSVRLAKELPPTTKSCRVKYTKAYPSSTDYIPQRIQCVP
jgi:hypothetical protein